MNTVIRHFASLVSRLIAEVREINNRFRALHGDIQKQIEAVSKASDAQAERDKTPPILRAELQIPEAVEHKKESQNRKKYAENGMHLF